MSVLTSRCIAYLGHKEGLTTEAYKDSVGVWTWALGVTNASGHNVDRYKDKPSSLEEALDVSVWLIREKYFPAVNKAFPNLTEPQLAAALSFHWNTGAISRLKGNFANATQWHKPASLVPRRDEEQDLFNDGKWPKSLLVPLYPVSKPSYAPGFGKAKLIDILPLIKV